MPAEVSAFFDAPGAGEAARRLCREIEVLGASVLSARPRHAASPGGALLCANARHILASDAAAAQFSDHLATVLARGLAVSVAIRKLGRQRAEQRFAELCELLARAAVDASADARSIDLVIGAGGLAPGIAILIRRQHLGRGRIFVRADDAHMLARAGSEVDRAFWPCLWRLRDDPDLRPVYAPSVTSPCRLLSAERAATVLPLLGVQVPIGSAWVPIRVDLPRFADAVGNLDARLLDATLARCVEIGDLLHDLTAWPTARMRHDGWLNRRLAIVVTGIGELTVRRALDPCSFVSLTHMQDTLREVRRSIVDASRRIAGRTETLPALRAADPSLALPRNSGREPWRRRWRDALDRSALRHRNLLVMSPWSLFPRSRAADYRYANLVPLLSLCDACAFTAPRPLAGWCSDEFRSFHRHVWAVLRERTVARYIAEQV